MLDSIHHNAGHVFCSCFLQYTIPVPFHSPASQMHLQFTRIYTGKYTAHEFKKMLKTDTDNSLASFAVDAQNKAYEFWKRDSLAIHLFSKEIAYQKLDYIHYNPCTEYWQLAKEPNDYLFSSAKYYETGIKNFRFLKDLRDEF